MSGKKTIFIIIAVTVIALILTWFWLQQVIVKYDLDRAMNTSNQLISSIKGTSSYLHITWLNFSRKEAGT